VHRSNRSRVDYRIGALHAPYKNANVISRASSKFGDRFSRAASASFSSAPKKGRGSLRQVIRCRRGGPIAGRAPRDRRDPGARRVRR
jgi:hypothetical protein